MKINEKVLSIPPFISTGWQNIVSLHDNDGKLMITLKEGHSISISDLPEEVIKDVFKFHTLHLEEESNVTNMLSKRLPPFGPVSPGNVQFPILGFNDGLGNAMQHNPAQADAPDIPLPILQKIGAIAKIVAPETTSELPQPEPGCNCMHCQIARTINYSVELEEMPSTKHEEVVLEKELSFQQWEVRSETDKMYSVINKLDTTEHFHVYLDPIGCTCGNHGCEHVIAVLKS